MADWAGAGKGRQSLVVPIGGLSTLILTLRSPNPPPCAQVDQVAAMEARRAAISAPPLYYLFPYNSGLTPSDAQRLLSLGLPSERVVWDLHVGVGGAMQQSADAMAHPPVPGFNLSTINCETNAETHDMNRALAEAADMIVWMAALPELATRVLGRAASFVAGRSGHFDGYDQALAFFLPDRTW